MRKISPPYVWSAVSLYGLGVALDVGSAYGLPSDGRDHSAPVAVTIPASTGSSIVAGSISITRDTISGVDLSAAPPYRAFKFTISSLSDSQR